MRKAVKRFLLVEEILLLSDWSKRKACLPVTLIVKVEQNYFVDYRHRQVTDMNILKYAKYACRKNCTFCNILKCMPIV